MEKISRKIECNVCDTDYYPQPENNDNIDENDCTVYCNADITCSSNGSCDNDTGLCICNSSDELRYFDGVNCNYCQENYYPNVSLCSDKQYDNEEDCISNGEHG